MKAIALDRKRFGQLADGIAVALAVSLPWSTSATSILAGLWLLTLIPTLDLASLRRVILTPAGGLPVLLAILGAVGMLWADVSWTERFDGMGGFVKLLLIPLLLQRYEQPGDARPVLIAFLASCTVLLVVSWLSFAWPGMPWPGRVRPAGIPVKDYVAQSAMFTVCIFAILQFAYDKWRASRGRLALALVVFALIFLANVFYVANAKTSFVVIAVLMVVFGYRLFGWKGAVGLIVGGLVLAAAAWPTSMTMQFRVTSLIDEIRAYRPDAGPTSAGERLVYWNKSVGFIRQSPLIGHGTGSIREQFRRSVVGQTGMAAQISANPHNQILAVGIQLGLIGIAALLAMWIAHLVLFQSGSVAAWIGLVVVVQNIVGSLFNSHLFDFTHGWAYVLGVGIAGGIALKESRPKPQPGRPVT